MTESAEQQQMALDRIRAKTQPLDGIPEEAIAPLTPQPVTLWGTDDPKGIVARATNVANALADVVNKRKLFAVIQQRKYVTIEGWELLGSMMGVFPRTVWTRKLEENGGFEARVEAVVAATGMVIGAAEQQCSRSEKTWKDRDDYALRGMAQTRATSRALRQPLGFVLKLAGFEAVGAEEMPKDG